MENLCSALSQFLSQALQEAWTGHATEQANGCGEVCDDMVYAKIEEWSRQHDKQEFYNEPALMKHKQIFDIMKYTKEGFAKENTFLPWCRKINKLRIQVASTATERAESSTATEHAESPALLQSV